MLSPKQAAQPNPSYPALSRKGKPHLHGAPTTEEQLNSDTNAGKEEQDPRKRKKKEKEKGRKKREEKKRKGIGLKKVPLPPPRRAEK